MLYIDFEDKLKEFGINKKEFAELSSLPYQTVMNWSNSKRTPAWVESWLENYRKARAAKIAADAMRDAGFFDDLP